MRPKTLSQIVGQQHLLKPGGMLQRMIQSDMLYSIILYGPPGTGKTSIAHVIACTTNMAFRQINATTAGKADMKKVVEEALTNIENGGKGSVLFIDEIHRFNKAQQDYLLPYVENGTIVLIGATTENPYFEVNGALLSRSRIFELKPLSDEDIITAVKNAVLDTENGLGNIPIYISKETLEYLAKIVDGDLRQALNAVELAVETTNLDETGFKVITNEIISECTQKKIMRFDKNGDNHYDFISAFIESMKHSEPDAVLYYLARMIESGEDPKYVARRIFVCAYRDIALADPNAINIAASAFLAVERIGTPECWDALAMAALYNTCAPKSNSASEGLAKAREHVNATGNIPIPAFLQDESYKSAHKLGRGGVSDIFATPYHYDGTDCLPEAIKGTTYFTPQQFGDETRVKQYLNWCNQYKAMIKKEN